jgi:hypothetical protein
MESPSRKNGNPTVEISFVYWVSLFFFCCPFVFLSLIDKKATSLCRKVMLATSMFVLFYKNNVIEKKMNFFRIQLIFFDDFRWF